MPRFCPSAGSYPVPDMTHKQISYPAGGNCIIRCAKWYLWYYFIWKFMDRFYHTRILLLYISSSLGTVWKGKFHFHPDKLYSKGLWSKEKKGGANRRVELDKLARLQIRDWNLHGGLCKSFEKEVVKRNRRWRNFVIISILYYQNIIRMEYQSGMKLFIYDHCYFSDFACYYYFISFPSIFINIFRFPNETKRYLFESPYKRKYKTNRKICGKKRVELNPSGWGTN